MEITGISLTLLEVPEAVRDRYNRWYDLDHLPEHLAKPDVVTAARFMATARCADAPGTVTAGSNGSHPAGGRDEAVRWWDTTQQAELLDLPGVVSIMRFEPNDDSDQLLHVIGCQGHPAHVMERIDETRRFEVLTARHPAFKGVYETEILLPYERVVPLVGIPGPSTGATS